MASRSSVLTGTLFPVYVNETVTADVVLTGVFLSETSSGSTSISASEGTYSLSGNSITLSYSGNPSIDITTGLYLLNGNDQTLNYSVLSIDNGNYSLNGRSVTLSYSGAASSGGASGPKAGMFGLGLGGPVISPFSTGSTVPLPVQIVGTRGQISKDSVRTVTAANLKRTYRTNHYFGCDASDVRIAFAGWKGQDGNVGNDQTVECGIEISGVTKMFTFAGAATGTIVNGIPIYITDPIFPSDFSLTKFSSQTQFWLRHGYEVASSSQVIPTYYVANAGAFPVGESAVSMATGVASLVSSTGALPGTGGAYTALFDWRLPLAILGTPLTSTIAYLGLGDSIMDSVSDAQGDPSVDKNGWFGRALMALPSFPPFVRIAVTGTTAGGMGTTVAQVLAKPRAVLWPYAPGGTLVCEYGGNDISSGASAASAYNSLKTIFSAARQAGMTRIMQTTIPPRSHSTDSFVTPIAAAPATNNQTPTTNYQAGSIRDSLNTLITNGVGVDFNTLVDTNAALVSPYYTDETIVSPPFSGGTGVSNTLDGTHQNVAGNTLMKAAFLATI